MASADLGNLHIFYEDMGSGPVVLLIHGSFTRGDEAFSSLLPRLAAQYRVLCPDLRGHGRSRCEDLFWDEPMLARDMLRLLNAVIFKFGFVQQDADPVQRVRSPVQ